MTCLSKSVLKTKRQDPYQTGYVCKPFRFYSWEEGVSRVNVAVDPALYAFFVFRHQYNEMKTAQVAKHLAMQSPFWSVSGDVHPDADEENTRRKRCERVPVL